MKKFLTIAAFALLFFPACTEIEMEEMPARKIAFNVGHYFSGTKADPSTKHALQGETEEFTAKAFLHADNGEGGFLATQDMFGTAGDLVKYHAPDGTGRASWETDNEYFWPKAEASYINFVSWYTENAKAQFTAASVTETQMNWGDNANPITIVSDDNILFADLAYHFKNNETRNQLVSNVSEGVPTIFHHALAKIAFDVKLKTSSQAAKTLWDVTVEGATLKIGNNGYLPLSISGTALTGTDAVTIPWTVNGTAATSEIVGWSRPSTGATQETISADFQTATFTGFAPKTLDATTNVYETATQPLLAERTVLPQDLGTDVKLSVTFRINIFHDVNGDNVKDEANPFSQEIVTFDETSLASLVSAIPSWKMNTKYIYTITIDPVNSKIVFDPAVVDWVDDNPSGTINR